MQDISGFGLELRLIASTTFPQGIVITQYADDADGLDVPDLQVGDSAMGLNGDLIVWSKANPIKVNLSVIAGSQDDQNLSVLLEVNRPGRGKILPIDVLTMNVTYKQGNFVQLINGAITDGAPFSAVSSSGRLKSKTYNFTFENRIGG
jgi:hypothetical protein